MSQGVQSHPSCRWQEGPPRSPPRAYGGPADTSISDLCLQSLSEDMSVAERSVCGPGYNRTRIQRPMGPLRFPQREQTRHLTWSS